MSQRSSASRYGDTDVYEWFAENFSAYFMGNRDKVDPKFLPLIEAIMRNDTKFFED